MSDLLVISIEEECFLSELSREDLETLMHIKSHPPGNRTILPDPMLAAILEELGYSITDYDHTVLEALREIANEMVSTTLTFAAACADRTKTEEISAKDVANFFDMAYHIRVLGFSERHLILSRFQKY